MNKILDACCGSKMFWFDKHYKNAVYCDIREVHDEVIWESKDGSDKRMLTVEPDIVADFRSLPFDDETFWHIVFDPPHLLRLGDSSWMAKKYGNLKSDTWRDLIHDGFAECWRVLKPNGTLIFKWSEKDISVSEVLKAIERTPMYGHRSGKHMTTHWMAFFKEDDEP